MYLPKATSRYRLQESVKGFTKAFIEDLAILVALSLAIGSIAIWAVIIQDHLR